MEQFMKGASMTIPGHVKVLLDSNPLKTRVEQMTAIGNGWLDGKGVAPDRGKLIWLAEQFDALFDGNLTLPYLYPTAEGGVQAEWTLNGREVSLEIDLENKQAEYQALNLKDDTCSEFRFSLADQDGWNKLNEALKQLETQKVEEPKQPDRIEMGTRRYYPERYEVVYDGLSLVVLVVIGLLVVFWP